MQYTTQQLQGGPKYSHKTRIGNWNEDFELSNVQKQNYDGKKANETLPFSKTFTKYVASYRQVPWSYSPDGCISWNQQVMIQNAQTEGWLTVDVGDKVPNVEEAYTVTSTSRGQNPGPMTRSVYQLIRVEDADIFGSDEYLRYGQKVRFESNQYLYRKKLGLASYKHSPTVCSQVSNKQVACMTAARPDANSVWVLDHVDPNVRFEMQGEIVKSGEPLLIRHIQTAVYLGADSNSKYKNDFGTENEVHCHNHSTKNKSQNLALENEGRLTSDIPTKFQQDYNVFFIQTAPDASYARAIEDLSSVEIGDLVKDLKSKILDRSPFGVRGLARIFKAMDQKGDSNLDVDDFRWGLMDFGIQVTKEEATQVLEHFDIDKNGLVNFNEFLMTLKGNLSPARVEIVKKAYEKLDMNKDGQVKLDDIAKAFDASNMKDVLMGKRSEQDVYMEYMSLWDTQVKDGIITFDEFLAYYADISCSIDDDDEFVQKMAEAWKL